MSSDIFGDTLDQIFNGLNDFESEMADLICDIQGEIESSQNIDYISPEDAAPDLDLARTHIQDALELITSYKKENADDS